MGSGAGAGAGAGTGTGAGGGSVISGEGGGGVGAGFGAAQETGASNIANINPVISIFFMIASYILFLSAGLAPSGCRFMFSPIFCQPFLLNKSLFKQLLTRLKPSCTRLNSKLSYLSGLLH